jgi:pimeloyl-ACP methyl ester carboxylesterase
VTTVEFCQPRKVNVRPRCGSAIVVACVALAGCSSDDVQTSATTVPPATATALPTTSVPVEEGGAPSPPESTASIEPPSTLGSAEAPTDYDTPEGTVRLLCSGDGDVPVVLLAGGDDRPRVWDGLVDALGPSALVCRYDPSAMNAGITATSRADALSDALAQSGLPGPFVLVGHSLSGLVVRQFGANHPDQLGGAVLLDPTAPSFLVDADAALADLGWDTAALHVEADATVAWPPVPLRVLAHDPTDLTLETQAREDEWTAAQQAYAALSPLGTYEAVASSGHFVYLDAPDAVVTAINDVIAVVSP